MQAQAKREREGRVPFQSINFPPISFTQNPKELLYPLSRHLQQISSRRWFRIAVLPLTESQSSYKNYHLAQCQTNLLIITSVPCTPSSTSFPLRSSHLSSNWTRYPISEREFRTAYAAIHTESGTVNPNDVRFLPLLFVVLSISIKVAPEHIAGDKKTRNLTASRYYWSCALCVGSLGIQTELTPYSSQVPADCGGHPTGLSGDGADSTAGKNTITDLFVVTQCCNRVLVSSALIVR